MNEDWRSLLKPEVLNEVAGLELIARVIVEGYISGMHTSRKTGAGLEFSQYRGYEPGDDLRLLDWKMLARSGRYYIKQSEIDTNVILKVVMDASDSMRYEENDISKWQYARLIAATLGYLSSKQRDDIGLFALNDQKFDALNPRDDRKQLQRYLQKLLQIELSGKWPENAAIDVMHTRNKKEIVVFISDFLQANNEVTEAVSALKTGYNEVIACYVVGRKEESLDFEGNIVFEDLETGERREVNATKVKLAYKQQRQQVEEKIKHDLQEAGIAWIPVYMDDNPGHVLKTFLKQRNRLIR